MGIDYDTLDLRNKTAFDFTSDPEILKAIDLNWEDKEQFINFALPIAKAFSILDYAEHVGDKLLIEAVTKEFKTEFDTYFNE